VVFLIDFSMALVSIMIYCLYLVLGEQR
jgi:hypothetical protein